MAAALRCAPCNKEFKNAQGYKEHHMYSKAHGGSRINDDRRKLVPKLNKPAAPSTYTCDQCEKCFVDRNGLQNHIDNAPRHKKRRHDASDQSANPPVEFHGIARTASPNIARHDDFHQLDMSSRQSFQHPNQTAKIRSNHPLQTEAGAHTNQWRDEGSYRRRNIPNTSPMKHDPINAASQFNEQDVNQGMRQSDYACGRCGKAFPYKIDQWNHMQDEHPQAVAGQEAPPNDRPSWDDTPAWSSGGDHWEDGWGSAQSSSRGWETQAPPAWPKEQWPAPQESAQAPRADTQQRNSGSNSGPGKLPTPPLEQNDKRGKGNWNGVAVNPIIKGKARMPLARMKSAGPVRGPMDDEEDVDVTFRTGEGLSSPKPEQRSPGADSDLMDMNSVGHSSSIDQSETASTPRAGTPNASKSAAQGSSSSGGVLMHSHYLGQTDSKHYVPTVATENSSIRPSEAASGIVIDRLDEMKRVMEKGFGSLVKDKGIDVKQVENNAFERGKADGRMEVLRDFVELGGANFFSTWQTHIETVKQEVSGASRMLG